jgi:hypothetical protein
VCFAVQHDLNDRVDNHSKLETTALYRFLTVIQHNLDITILDLAISLTVRYSREVPLFFGPRLTIYPHNDYRKDLWSGDYR